MSFVERPRQMKRRSFNDMIFCIIFDFFASFSLHLCVSRPGQKCCALVSVFESSDFFNVTEILLLNIKPWQTLEY